MPFSLWSKITYHKNSKAITWNHSVSDPPKDYSSASHYKVLSLFASKQATFICQRRLGLWQLYSWCGPAALRLVPSELSPNTHLPTSEEWTAKLTVGLWLVVPTIGFEHTRVDPTRFETLRLNHLATPPILPTLTAWHFLFLLKEGTLQSGAFRTSKTRKYRSLVHIFEVFNLIR